MDFKMQAKTLSFLTERGGHSSRMAQSFTEILKPTNQQQTQNFM